MNLEERVDLVWRLQRWHGLNDPELVHDEIGDYLVAKQDDNKKSKKEDDADIAQTKKNLEDMAEEVRRREQAIRDDPGR